MGGIASAIVKGGKVVKPKPKGKLTRLENENARQARRVEGGLTTKGYHGSTHPDIKEFKLTKSNAGNDMGEGTYITTSAEDASANYATAEGADIQARIAGEVDKYLDDLEVMTEEAIYKMGEDLGVPFWQVRSYIDDPDYLAEIFAKKSMTGGEGTSYPVWVNTNEFATVGGDNATFHSWDTADEAYEDIEYALFNTGYFSRSDADDVDLVKLIAGEVWEEVEIAGDFSLTELDRLIRREVPMVEDPDTYEMVGAGSVTNKVLNDLGYKGIVDNTVNDKFGASRKYGKGMEGVDENTSHLIVFKGNENLIKSEFAQFKDLASKSITAGVAGAMGHEALKSDKKKPKGKLTRL